MKDGIPQNFAKQGSLSICGGEVFNGSQNGCQPLRDELPDTVFGGEVC